MDCSFLTGLKGEAHGGGQVGAGATGSHGKARKRGEARPSVRGHSACLGLERQNLGGDVGTQLVNAKLMSEEGESGHRGSIIGLGEPPCCPPASSFGLEEPSQACH